MTGSKPDQPDHPPKHLCVGVVNPFALVEAIVGRKLNWYDTRLAHTLSSMLQTDYEELFDLRFNSILYAGIRLNDRGDEAELIPAKDMKTLTERDLVTPDFSRVEKLGDLGHLGLKDLNEIKVKNAVMSNGNLRLTLEPSSVGKTLCNSEMTTTLRELCTPFRLKKEEEWTPPNGSWADIGTCSRQEVTMFSNPVQGAASDSWLIAALMSVAWSDPSVIKHCTRPSSSSDRDSDDRTRREDCSLSVKLHSKGGDMDAPTKTVTVNCELPTNNSSSMLIYCRPSSMDFAVHRTWAPTAELWPALYEKAFAQWLNEHKKSKTNPESSSNTNHPDLTQPSHGDPVKALVQLTDKNPHYFMTAHRQSHDLLGLVRTHSVNLRTIYPTVAWTHPSNEKFRGCTLVGNMAYSVLGWAAPQERKQYIILRHPWGVTEPEGVTSYPGVVSKVDSKFWPPVDLVEYCGRGVLAIERESFKEYFAGLGIAK